MRCSLCIWSAGPVSEATIAGQRVPVCLDCLKDAKRRGLVEPERDRTPLLADQPKSDAAPIGGATC